MNNYCLIDFVKLTTYILIIDNYYLHFINTHYSHIIYSHNEFFKILLKP